jgi:regulator of sirC expression with transglutaminase-like and TPR domain
VALELPGSAGEFFRQVRLPDSQLDLARAALGIAAAFNPDLDDDAYGRELDLMAEALSHRAAAARNAHGVLRSLNRYLFDELGFRGNSSDYEDPRNSYLNEVLDRRLGIPITLCVIFMEIGRRNGLELDGVGYPGHFLVRWSTPEGMPLFLDPFNRGTAYSAESLLDELATAGLAAERSRSLMAAVTKRQILTRMLQNLKAAFAVRKLPELALRASHLALEMSPWDLDERRDHGLIAYAAGERDLAIDDLETYLLHRADAVDARRVERQLVAIRHDIASSRGDAAGNAEEG